jgi:hypothetical protein
MGVTCSKYDYEGKILCKKCGDRYKPSYGGKSQRNSCRNHRYAYNNGIKFCIDCWLQINDKIAQNCYHCY